MGCNLHRAYALYFCNVSYCPGPLPLPFAPLSNGPIVEGLRRPLLAISICLSPGFNVGQTANCHKESET